MNNIHYSNWQELPREVKAILIMDKDQTPNPWIRKFQNGDFTVREKGFLQI